MRPELTTLGSCVCVCVWCQLQYLHPDGWGQAGCAQPWREFFPTQWVCDALRPLLQPLTVDSTDGCGGPITHCVTVESSRAADQPGSSSAGRRISVLVWCFQRSATADRHWRHRTYERDICHHAAKTNTFNTKLNIKRVWHFYCFLHDSVCVRT